MIPVLLYTVKNIIMTMEHKQCTKSTKMADGGNDGGNDGVNDGVNSMEVRPYYAMPQNTYPSLQVSHTIFMDLQSKQTVSGG